MKSQKTSRIICPPMHHHATKLVHWFNRLIQEAPGIVENEHVTLTQEKKYLNNLHQAMQKSKVFCLLYLLNERVVAKVDVHPLSRRVDSHVGEVSFGCLKGFQREGIRLLQKVKVVVRKKGIHLLIYPILADNTFFQSIFKEARFQKVGRIPRFYKIGQHYMDRIWWACQL